MELPKAFETVAISKASAKSSSPSSTKTKTKTKIKSATRTKTKTELKIKFWFWFWLIPSILFGQGLQYKKDYKDNENIKVRLLITKDSMKTDSAGR